MVTRKKLGLVTIMKKFIDNFKPSQSNQKITKVTENFIKLKSAEGDVFSVNSEIMYQSCTIRTMISDLDFKSNENMVIPLPKINTSILEKVVQWCDYCASINKTETKMFLDLDFLDLSTLQKLFNAAKYLDIQSLIDTTHRYALRKDSNSIFFGHYLQ